MKKKHKIVLLSILGIVLLLFSFAMYVNVAGIPSYEYEAQDLVVELTETRITDDEASAIWAYLQIVPVIHNPVK